MQCGNTTATGFSAVSGGCAQVSPGTRWSIRIDYSSQDGIDTGGASIEVSNVWDEFNNVAGEGVAISVNTGVTGDANSGVVHRGFCVTPNSSFDVTVSVTQLDGATCQGTCRYRPFGTPQPGDCPR